MSLHGAILRDSGPGRNPLARCVFARERLPGRLDRRFALRQALTRSHTSMRAQRSAVADPDLQASARAAAQIETPARAGRE